MKQLFDGVSQATSKLTTRTYSTSFSLGIYCLAKKFHVPIYNIYAYVRFADEIVDSFHDYEKELLLDEFERDTYLAIERRISLNPVLNSFQQVVHTYKIPIDLIDHFLASMRCDLRRQSHDVASYETYIYGSAEVVGLMCLKVFTEGNDELYARLKPGAQKLGSAFQKVNFLRDLKNDYQDLGRVYFPGINLACMSQLDKQLIEQDIEKDLNDALEGIKQLPSGACFGVYVAYIYYRNLFKKIKSLPPSRILSTRVRVPNYQKIGLLFSSYLRHSLNIFV